MDPIVRLLLCNELAIMRVLERIASATVTCVADREAIERLTEQIGRTQVELLAGVSKKP